MKAILAPELLAALRRIEARGVIETAHRALSDCSNIFRYGIATGRAERDPAADLRGALSPVKTTHFPAITWPCAIGELLRDLDGYETPSKRLDRVWFGRGADLKVNALTEALRLAA